MINYPNGKKPAIKQEENKKPAKRHLASASNRGMGLEDDINKSNLFYKEKGLCLITKRPTPINVVKVDYSKGAIITNAYFEKQSTTDYNGVYKSRYIDFEAKSTRQKTSFPLNNIPSQQIEHLKQVIRHGGIAFFIVEFATLDEVYFLDAQKVVDFIKNDERASLPLTYIKENGREIKRGYMPRLDYLPIIEEYYFNS